MAKPLSKPLFFPTSEDLRRWFEKYHDTADELVVGYYKKATGKPSITWQDSVDQALCFGWIDSIRHKINAEAFQNRFTPRKLGSIWSEVNTKRFRELNKKGMIHPAGLEVFKKRDVKKSKLYSYERANADLPDALISIFQSNVVAWDYFELQSPSYRKAAIWWVVSAKQDATQKKRLNILIKDSENKRPIALLRRPSKK